MFHRLLAVALAVSLAQPALAGKDPCKGVSVKKTAFGSTRVLDAGKLKLKQSEGTTTLFVSFDAGGGFGAWARSTAEQVPAGAEMQMKLSDDSIFTMQSSGITAPRSATIMGVLAVWYEVPFTVDATQVAAIVDGNPEVARLLLDGGREVIRKISKGDMKTFAKSAVCMMGS
jgi:hypothetical protein